MMDLEWWAERYASGGRPERPPSRWVLEAADGMPNDLPVADIAGGTGRHAIPIARRGRSVVLVDFVESAVRAGVAAEGAIRGVVADACALPLARGVFGLVVVANFLDRGIFPDLAALLAPGGCLVYETYTVPHLALVARGEAYGPSDPRFVLEPGELRSLVAPLRVEHDFEGEIRDEAGLRYCARVMARRDTLS